MQKKKIKNIAYGRHLISGLITWYNSLTEQDSEDLERVQKNACKIILKNKYESYEKALNIIDLECLSDKRIKLCKDFAQKAAKKW